MSDAAGDPFLGSPRGHAGEKRAWWLCPNEPRCPHGAVLHDIKEMDDPCPTCTVESCTCGKRVEPEEPDDIEWLIALAEDQAERELDE